MPSTKTIDDFPVGTKVEFNLDGIDVHGTVESIQIGKKLVDVKIYEPGHRQHCLIVSRAPETLFEEGEGPGPSSYADLQRRVEGAQASKEIADQLQAALYAAKHHSEAIEALTARVVKLETLLGAVESLQTRMDGVQAKVTALESPKPDGSQAA